MNLEKERILKQCMNRWKINLEEGTVYTQRGLAKFEDDLGFLRVSTTVNKKSYAFGVQEVIAYKGGLDIVGKNKKVVHINGDIQDNRLCNLKVVHPVSDNDVREIRRLRKEKNLTYVEIGKRFNLTSGTVGNIVNRRTYKNVM